MKTISMILTLLALIAANVASAGDKVTVVQRTDVINYQHVVAVGRCNLHYRSQYITDKYGDSRTVLVPYYAYTKHYCQGFVTYKANRSGSAWNRKYEKLPNTSKYFYKMREETKDFDIYDMNAGARKDVYETINDALARIQLERLCEDSRQLTEELRYQQRTANRCP